MVVVVHEIQVRAQSKTLVRVGVAEFIVVETLRLRHVAAEATIGLHVDVLLEIGATRLTIGNGEGGVRHVPAVLVRETGFWVEEMVLLRQVYRRHIFVVDALHLVVQEAVLQVAVDGKAFLPTVDDAPIGLGVAHPVPFAALVAVVLVVDRQSAAIVRVVDIGQSAEVVVHVVIAGDAYLHVCRLGDELRGNDRTVEMVVQILAVESKGFLYFVAVFIHVRIKPEVTEFLVLILLVVTASVRIVQRGVQAPVVRKSVRHVQLQVLLGVVVGLVVVIDRRVAAVGRFDRVLSGRVIAAVRTVDAIGGVVVHAIPGHAGLLVAAKETQHHFGLIAVVAEIAEIGVEVGRSAVQESVGVDLAEAGIESKAAVAYTRRDEVQ